MRDIGMVAPTLATVGRGACVAKHSRCRILPRMGWMHSVLADEGSSELAGLVRSWLWLLCLIQYVCEWYSSTTADTITCSARSSLLYSSPSDSSGPGSL